MHLPYRLYAIATDGYLLGPLQVDVASQGRIHLTPKGIQRELNSAVDHLHLVLSYIGVSLKLLRVFVSKGHFAKGPTSVISTKVA